MKKILIAIVLLMCAVSVCYAAQGDSPKATEPIGAVVETAGVFIGKMSGAVEDSMSEGKAEKHITVVDESGKTKFFPVDNTVKVLDTTFNALTLNQLKKGDKIAVEYSKDKSGKEKAKSVKVIK